MIDSYVKTKNGRKAIKAYTPAEMQLPVLIFKDQQKNHKITKYATKYICLDTETSHIGNTCGWVYQWAVKLGELYVYGRKPSEIIDFMERVAEHYELSDDKKIVLYIHNAAYDLQYLKLFLRRYDPSARFLAVDSHAIIECDVIGFKIVCSYKLTNMGLAALSDNYAELYTKAVGEIDYNIVRYQDSELTASDWFYMFSDVASQDDGIQGYLKMQGYRYAFSAPITSTGFVRANCRKAAKADDSWREIFRKTALSLEQYNLCRQCFMGGVCIASFKYSNKTIRSDKLRHKDFTSSYPARQELDYFPEGAPNWYGDVDSIEELEHLCSTYCCIFVLTLNNVHIKKGVTAPCIPSSKCIHKENYLKLNGKIVSASTLTIVVCELDYKWIKRQYTYDEDAIYIDKMLIFNRGVMPEWLKSEVFEYFKNKCSLKGVNELLYNKSKNMLNGVYGMTATAPVREVYEMNEEYILSKKDDNNAQKQLSKYYSSYNNFMPYQYSIFTTAHARDALYTMIIMTGDIEDRDDLDDKTDVYKNFLYCDTDSVFYIETEYNKSRMDAYAESCRKRAIDAGAFVDNKYLGEPTDEPPIRAFRAIHAKCYAMEEYKKKTGQYELTVVIAGIPKRATKWVNGKPIIKTNAEELGNIDNLTDGFTFKHCGGTRCVYNERPIEILNINGHITELASSAVIENIEKEISDTMYTQGADYSCLKIMQS